MPSVTVQQTQTRLPGLIQRLSAGEEFVIATAGQRTATLTYCNL